LAGSIREVLPVAFISQEVLLGATGGMAAAMAIGAFVGQAFSVLASLSEWSRRRKTAIGGLAGLLVMIGLILLSANGR
jgi:hypothetical protein